jgi:hypothetical protein
LCKLVFDIDPAMVAEMVNETNIIYGGRDISATRILWVNGVIDPWRAQAVTKSNDPVARPSILVPGASHHFWTHPARPTDSAFVVKARIQIGNFVASVLTEPRDSDLKAPSPRPNGSHANRIQNANGGKRPVVPGSGKHDATKAGPQGKGKDAHPANYMYDNKRLPGVPFAPFQVVEAA